MNLLKQLGIDKTPIINYLLYSIVVAVIDTTIVWFIVRSLLAELVIANTIGIVTGFLIHYFLSSKKVFDANYSIVGFTIYFITFIFGLCLANMIIFLSYTYIFHLLGIDLRILLSKGLSIVIPFFILYYLRKLIFESLCKKKRGNRVAP